MPLDLERGQATLPDHEALRLDPCLNRCAAIFKRQAKAYRTSIRHAIVDSLSVRPVRGNKNAARRILAKNRPAGLPQSLTILRKFPFVDNIKLQYAAGDETAKCGARNQLVAAPGGL